MADWVDVMKARSDAERVSGKRRGEDLNTNDPGICDALEAIRLEIRALAVLIDHARGDAR